MFRAALLFPLVLIAACSRPKEVETYRIAIKFPAKGEVVEVFRQEHVRRTSAKVDTRKNSSETEEDEAGVRDVVYREKIVEVANDGTPIRIHRVYEKAREKRRGEDRSGSFVGKTLVIEQVNGEYYFAVEGGDEIDDDELSFFQGEFDINLDKYQMLQWLRALQPDEPVAVNQPWNIDVPRLVWFFGNLKAKIAHAQCKYSGKLTRVWERDGRRYGRLEYLLDSPAELVAKDRFVVLAGSKCTAKVVIETCVDGSQVDYTHWLDSNWVATLAPTDPIFDGLQMKFVTHADIKEIRRPVK